LNAALLRRQRGASLIEALLAFAILGISMLGAMRMQTSLRLAADLARQRAEAVRIGQAAMEDWRSFAVLDATPGVPSYADIGSDSAPQTIAGGNATYGLTRTAIDASEPALKTASIDVSWLDRSGRAQSVALHSMIAGLDPTLSAALAISPATSPLKRPLGRHPWLPLAAHDLGNGSSVFKPGGSIAWVFDNATGALTGRCTVAAGATSETLMANDVKDCTFNTQGFVLSGFVRFSTGDAADAQTPSSAPMALHIVLDGLSGSDAAAHGLMPSAECFDDAAAPALPTAVSYHCAIYASGLAGWSGHSTIVPIGWALGLADGAFLACRYSADDNGDHSVANAEHPRLYAQVGGPLKQQNFLIIRGPLACPTGTVQHDPDGQDTPA
jgi:Tfp pilus assembly protein PilV